MTPDAISATLAEFFPDAKINHTDGKTWKIHQVQTRLHVLVSLSSDGQMLRVFIPIATQEEAAPYYLQLLEGNFNENKLVRYAMNQNLLWGVFKYPLQHLSASIFQQVLTEMLALHRQGLSAFFNQLAEEKVREIIRAAKSQGQTIEQTMQTITRFYEEGMMGDLDQKPRQQRQALLAWQYQLEKLWQEEK
ncbi:hypothetical protein NIES970_06950 [[Synechococcus] sp. NIES-970]|nr:hypothetical protein NIES970_06950 [[Synechococcus] sp. NIES-970]